MSITPEQYAWLTRGIDPGRVQHLRNQAHLEAWDVRRHLIRIFGYDGWTVETKALDLVREIEHPPLDPSAPPKDPKSRPRWTVIYRAEVRLSVKVAGQVVAVFEDAASGDSCNQPSLGDAHDMAMKTALSQGLKRCAVNLGDQFGLGLYNGGGTDPVVLRSLVAPDGVTPPPVPPKDAPVQPEPATGAAASIGEDSQPAPAVDVQALRARALDSRATKDDLLALHAQVKAAGLLDTEVTDGADTTVALGELIVRRGRELAATKTTADESPVSDQPAIGPAPAADTRHHRHMHALWRQLDVVDRDQRLALTSRIVGRQVATSGDLTAIEAEQVIGSLRAELDARSTGASEPVEDVGTAPPGVEPDDQSTLTVMQVRARIGIRGRELGMSIPQIGAEFRNRYQTHIGHGTVEQLREYLHELLNWRETPATPRGRVGLDAINQAISVATSPAELAAALEPVRTNPGSYNQGEHKQIDRWERLATTRVGAETAQVGGAQ